jgi:hypothetical protein
MLKLSLRKAGKKISAPGTVLGMNHLVKYMRRMKQESIEYKSVSPL